MDSEAFRLADTENDARQFFGDLAPLLEALNPAGWADRSIFTERLLSLCSGSILGLTSLGSPKGSKVSCYFAKDRGAAEQALEEVAERFEEKVEQWLAERFPGLTAATPADIFAPKPQYA
jgi:hypothetical protein